MSVRFCFIRVLGGFFARCRGYEGGIYILVFRCGQLNISTTTNTCMNLEDELLLGMHAHDQTVLIERDK
jgi:hypothetical protein